MTEVAWSIPNYRINRFTRLDAKGSYPSRAKVHLETVQVWDIVSGAEEKPDADKHNNWKRMNNYVKALLTEMIDDAYLYLISDNDLAKKAIEDKFDRKNGTPADEGDDPQEGIRLSDGRRVVEVEREHKYGFLADRDTIGQQWRNRHDRKRVRFFPTCWQQRFGSIQSPKPPDKFLQSYEMIDRLRQENGMEDVIFPCFQSPKPPDKLLQRYEMIDRLRQENGMEDAIFPGKYQSYSCTKHPSCGGR
ncbi:hypothetical protein BDZ91DRAFT_845499 [Kalaharituber pfeilii]|nr:hypothetical protein BDZ91DRAFT_845499 [Kalaharituber pfeilii]